MLSLIPLYYLAQFWNGTFFQIPVKIDFQQAFLTYAQMGLIQGAAGLLSIMLQLPTGALADSWGRRKTVIVGYIIAGIFAAGNGLFPNPLAFLLTMMIWTFGTTMISGADTAFLFDSLKHTHDEHQFGKINAYGILIYRVGMIIAMATGGYLFVWNHSLPYLFRAVTYFFAAATFLYMKGYEPTHEKLTRGLYTKRLQDGITSLFSTPYMARFSLYYILVGGLSWTVLFYYMNTLAYDVGYSPSSQGILFAGIYIVTTLILLFVTTKIAHIPEKIILIVFPLLMIIGFLPGIWLTKMTAVGSLMILILVGGARFTILDAILNHHLESAHRATALSGLNLFVTLLSSAIVAGLGLIQQTYKTTTVFTILGIACLIVLVPLTFQLIQKINAVPSR
jgi:MFS family permease